VPELSSRFQNYSAWKCFQEEVKELRDAEALPDIAKEMADVLVTLFGLAFCYGVDLEPVFEAVMASNDLKTGEKNSAGKVVKGPNYVAPDIASVLRAQGWEG
jgi:NTP pyrophosphatase (non-canonical NTP hydrolase)